MTSIVILECSLLGHWWRHGWCRDINANATFIPESTVIWKTLIKTIFVQKSGLQFDGYQSDILCFSVGGHLVLLRHFGDFSVHLNCPTFDMLFSTSNTKENIIKLLFFSQLFWGCVNWPAYYICCPRLYKVKILK